MHGNGQKHFEGVGVGRPGQPGGEGHGGGLGESGCHADEEIFLAPEVKRQAADDAQESQRP